jgi:hypothetical protein
MLLAVLRPLSFLRMAVHPALWLVVLLHSNCPRLPPDLHVLALYIGVVLLLTKGLKVCSECWSLEGQGVVGSHAGVPVGMCCSVVGHHVGAKCQRGHQRILLEQD